MPLLINYAVKLKIIPSLEKTFIVRAPLLVKTSQKRIVWSHDPLASVECIVEKARQLMGPSCPTSIYKQTLNMINQAYSYDYIHNYNNITVIFLRLRFFERASLTRPGRTCPIHALSKIGWAVQLGSLAACTQPVT